MVDDKVMIIFGVGGVGRYDNGTNGHHGQIGNRPFGTVFCCDQHTIAGVDTGVDEYRGEPRNLVCHNVPTVADPFAIALFK